MLARPALRCPFSSCTFPQQEKAPTHKCRAMKSLTEPSPGNAQTLDSLPELSKQWHPTQTDEEKTPATTPLGSSYKATWLCTACPCGHSHVWQAQVKMRAKGAKSGCPVCAGRIPCVCRSLAVLNPEVAAQWDYAKNEGLAPEKVTLSSNKAVWWLCKQHAEPHSWLTEIKARTRPGKSSRCPLCAREKRTDQGRKQQPLLIHGSPDVAAQWHPNRNVSPTPEDVTCGSQRLVWWMCPGCQTCGRKHEWQAKVSTRTLLGNGCAVCAGQRPCMCNSLAKIYADIVKAEWDEERNSPLSARDLLPQSNQPVWWRCNKHQPPFQWIAAPRDRFGTRRTGCPECSKSKRWA